MLDMYLNQTITWRSRDSSPPNSYNENTFTTSSVAGRIVYKRKMVRLANSEEITSHAFIYTSSKILEGDEITLDNKNWVVREVYPYVFFDGSVMGYEVVL